MTPPKQPAPYDPDLPPEPLTDDMPPEPAELAGPPEPEDLAGPLEPEDPEGPSVPPPPVSAVAEPSAAVPPPAVPPTPAPAPVPVVHAPVAQAPARPSIPASVPTPPPKKPDALERQRTALAAEIHNPRGADPRAVVVPLVVLLLLLGGGALFVHVWADTEDSSRTTRQEVKTAHQERLERERALQDLMPNGDPPILADLPAEPSASGGPSVEQTAPPAPATAPPTRRAPRVTQPAAPRVTQLPPPEADAPEAEAPARQPRRSLATSMATSFADAPPTSTSSASVARGTFLPACLTAVADPSQSAPFTAVVSTDVKAGDVVAVPRTSTLVCTGHGISAARLTGSCDTLTIPGRGSPSFAGLLYGKDRRPGLPVILSGGPIAGDDARDTALTTAERVLGSVSPGGLGGELLQGAAGAGGRAVRNSARPSESSARPVPKGTCFLVFVDQPF
ncbi:hypothetical protein [Archangium lansingense]|uniref:Uncharacterized protein n=1 Tax=Archangium lansingense TaxID=2995310 RepID=A0ABT4AQ06_9BACT|nr:hypothetical protein [Archangium lansinium]MCY1083773.1 hypothetical protein [Archangium lansinium]